MFDIQANFVPKDPFSFAPFSAAPPAACIRRQEVIQFPGSSHPCAIFHRSRQFNFSRDGGAIPYWDIYCCMRCCCTVFRSLRINIRVYQGLFLRRIDGLFFKARCSPSHHKQSSACSAEIVIRNTILVRRSINIPLHLRCQILFLITDILHLLL